MQNFELFHHNPLDWKLVNDGVSSNNSTDETTLKYELKTFVCEGQYEKSLDRLLRSFLSYHDQSEVPAGWISGFYGSGKSHLVKILRYLWNDHTLSDGSSARGLATLPTDIQDSLTELSTIGKRNGGLHAVGGTLKSGSGNVRLRLLSLVFQSVGLHDNYPQATFSIALKKDGHWDAFKKFIADQGKDLDREFQKFYTSKVIQQAYLEIYPHLGDLPAVAETIRHQFKDVEEIAIPKMLTVFKDAISQNGVMPYTLVVLDELQQFMGDDASTVLDVQEVVEACSKELQGKVMVVATGQSALNETPNLQRLLGRFTIKVGLSDNDVESVIREIALRKKDAHKNELSTLLSSHEGEITRQLSSTKIATTNEDKDYYVSDYPLLPVRRRFWEKVLRNVDKTGSTGQLRTQLRVVHEANKAYANQPVGTIVAADFIYEQLSTQLVTLGELQRRFQEIIEEQKSKPKGELRSRICALAFLIQKLPNQGGADLGIRANEDQLADLLVEDLKAGSSELRKELPELLQSLVDEGVMMLIEKEYRLQTTEGAAWEQEYQGRVAQLKNDTVRISNEQTSRIQQALNLELTSIRIPHGSSGQNRPINIHHGIEPPSEKSTGIPLWVRSGWSEPESTVLDYIRTRNEDDPTLFLYIPKQSATELQTALAEAMAAESTLTFKGIPASPEGIEARSAIDSRKTSAEHKVTQILNKIISGAKLYLAGGEELDIISLPEAIKDAGGIVLSKVYPKFSAADSSKWSSVRKKAQDGSAHALSEIGYSGNPEQHPVAAKILNSIGSSKKGTELRALFAAPPYGWSQDAVDAVLAVLLNSGHITATFQGDPITSKDDQRRLGSASYRVEGAVLTAAEKLNAKKFFNKVGINTHTGDVVLIAKEVVASLMEIAQQAGGETPLPAPPSITKLRELKGLQGKALVKEILTHQDSLQADLETWQKRASLATQRNEAWKTALALFEKLKHLDGSEAWKVRFDAIKDARSLLDIQDPISPLRDELADAGRTRLNELFNSYNQARATICKELENHDAWKALSSSDQSDRLRRAGMSTYEAPTVSDASSVLNSLTQCPLSTWKSRIDALQAQANKALEALLHELEPKAKHLKVPGVTIKSDADLDDWLASTKSKIQSAMQDGPVILS